jgi:hypothetical protein
MNKSVILWLQRFGFRLLLLLVHPPRSMFGQFL